MSLDGRRTSAPLSGSGAVSWSVCASPRQSSVPFALATRAALAWGSSGPSPSRCVREEASRRTVAGRSRRSRDHNRADIAEHRTEKDIHALASRARARKDLPAPRQDQRPRIPRPRDVPPCVPGPPCHRLRQASRHRRLCERERSARAPRPRCGALDDEVAPRHKSCGRSPVDFAILASIRGPTSSPSWKANTSSRPSACRSNRWEPRERATLQPLRSNAASTRDAFVAGHSLMPRG